MIKKIIVPISIIFFAVILRLLPHPPNVAPITAMALFGGVYMNRKFALIVPLIALFISDLVLGFHDTMIYVYGSFFISGLIGIFLNQRKTFHTVLIGTFIATILFFLITNFGVWAAGSMYPKTSSGLIQSYLMGIPFYRNTIIGDYLYVGIFFFGYELFMNILHSSRKIFDFIKN